MLDNSMNECKPHKNFDTEQNECLAEIMSDTTNVKVRSVVPSSNEDERDNLEHTYLNTIGHKVTIYVMKLVHMVNI